MKVAFIINNITSEGGTERVVVNLCNFMADQPGYRVEIHSLSSTGGNPFFVIDERINIFHHGLMDYSKDASRTKKAFKKIANTFSILSVFGEIRADILVGTGKHINIYLLLFRRFGKAKKIGCEHFSHSAPMSRSIRWLRKTLYSSLDALVVLNKADLAYYSEFMTNVVLIPNFVFFTPVGPASLDNKLALAVGRHSAEKGFDTLIEIWKMVNKAHPDWRLKVIGSGPLLETHIAICRKLELSEVIEFAEPTKEIILEYNAASLYILTSRTEAFPMALLEAMASGVPCVSFDCEAGPRDILTDQEDGYLVEVGNNKGMADAINILIENAGLRRQFGVKAFENTSRFYLESIGYKWIDLFKKVAAL